MAGAIEVPVAPVAPPPGSPAGRPRARLAGVLLAAAVVFAGPAALAQAPPPPSSSTTSTTTSTVSTSTPSSSTTVPGSTTTTVPLTVPTLPPLPTSVPEPDPGAPDPEIPLPTILPPTPGQVPDLKQLEEQFEDATADELDFLKRYLDAQAQAQLLGAQVDGLNEALATVTRELAVAEAEVRAADQRVADTTARLRDAQWQLLGEQRHLSLQAVEAYMGGGSAASPTDALLSGSDANEAGTSMVYAGAVVDETRNTVRRVEALRNRVAGLRDEAVAARKAATAARDEVAAREVGVRRQRDEELRLQQAVEAQARLQQELLVEAAERRSDYAARIAALNRVSDGIAGTLAKRQVGQVPPAITVGLFLSPLTEPKITSLFGPRSDPFLGTVRIHAGVDFSAPTGTPIRASADGEVVIAGEQGGYGLCTVIDHGSGLGTLYGHQSVLGVQPGQRVTKGQVIGFVGSTGRSTGPHLHWEVRRLGQPVDPLPYLAPG